MKTKIFDTILQWIPDSNSWLDGGFTNDGSLSHYFLLKRTAQFCIDKMNSVELADVERAREVIKVINMLYETGTHYTRNAIENEFFAELISKEHPASLKQHLGFLSKESKEGYLRTILEN